MSTKKKRNLPGWMRDPKNPPSTGQSVSSTLTPCSSRSVPKADQTTSTDRHIDENLSDEETSLHYLVQALENASQSSSEDISDSHTKHTPVNRGEYSKNLSLNNSPTNDNDKDAEENHEDEEISSTLNRSVTPCPSTPDTQSVTSTGVMPSLVKNGMISPAARKSCYYGSSCYRKNPQHRTDFAHPGDPDYSDTANGATASTSQNTVGSHNDNRPLCEYGSACYRKNPQHHRDFRHDAPQKRKARPGDLKDIPSDNEGDFDASFGSDDYNPGDSESDDSFVTSDSVDSGDSDYDPQDKEESEKKAGKRKKKGKQIKKRAKND